MSEPPLYHGARVAADDVRVVEAGETIVTAGERDRLNVWHRHVGQELIDHAHEDRAAPAPGA